MVTPVMPPEQNPAPLPPIETLLCSGSDARLMCGPDGANKYGCFLTPRPGTLSFGSSTASTISTAGFYAVTQLYRRLEKDSRAEAAAVTYARELSRIRREFVALCDLDSMP